MVQGTVKTVTDKGFGFITIDDASDASDRTPKKDVFYHERNLTGDLAMRKLRVGDKVTFEVEETEKGMNATNIKLVE